jgi:hypothetical protein
MNGKEFAEWVDKTGLSLEDAASLFGTSEQTIYKWRSVRGVPASKSEWVRKVMAEQDAKEISTLPNRVILEPSRKQWRAWGHAALAAGQILDDWALDALDVAAALDDEGNDSTPPSGGSKPSQEVQAAKRPIRSYSLQKDLVS